MFVWASESNLLCSSPSPIDHQDRQCIFSAFGGIVDVTGEILHGKTSPLQHDAKGLYAGLPQDLPVTRYHSLAGTHATLPSCLEVSSWISRGPDGGKGIIMGVRHKEFLVEGVQFHPESILTAEGRTMLKNFLRMQGGTWVENAKFEDQRQSEATSRTEGVRPVVNVTSKESVRDRKQDSILDRIYAHRRQAVEAQKKMPSQRLSDLLASFDLGLAPARISFPERLRSSPFSLSLLAEIKRASPSKGEIAMDICAPAQARKYALAGASVISVLTEPEWFKGSIDDLRAVRQSLDGLTNRPAVLRKEFIFDEYQILEARLAGADTVLLIVKMLEKATLERLYSYSQSLGMEPLVEVNTVEEMKVALELGALVIGVNNRNLTSFEVDLNTTSRLMEKVPKGTIVLALSGISGPDDVQVYKNNGVSGVLVGEALMRATDVTAFVRNLLGASQTKEGNFEPNRVLVKICGTRSVEAARAAIDAGADMIGIILVEGRKRYVDSTTALAISAEVHRSRSSDTRQGSLNPFSNSSRSTDFFENSAKFFSRGDRPLLVGVFQNQHLSHILSQQRLLDLDIVQLHGSEPLEWATLIPVPVIRRFGPNDTEIFKRGYHALPLLDSAAGGTGESLNLEAVRKLFMRDPELRLMIAGGLNAENVQGVLHELREHRENIVAVDISSGVEQDGRQSLEKIRRFIQTAKILDTVAK